MDDKEIVMDKQKQTGIVAGLSRVRWHAVGGHLEGRVVRIDIAKNAAGKWIEWLIIDNVERSNGRPYSLREDDKVRIPTTAMAMLKMEVFDVADLYPGKSAAMRAASACA